MSQEAAGMIKLFSPDGWGGLSQINDHQIKVASGGLGYVDRKDAESFASPELLHWLSRMDTHPDCVYVHKVAMGASDKFGPNRWGDGFREAVLERDCPTFEQFAKAYRMHKSAGAPYYGRPKLARLRKDMGTVELVTEYYGTDKIARANGGLLADKELEQLARHGSIAVSMGSKVPGDQCFPAGTLVTTDNGLVPIESLRVGDQVLTHSARFRSIRRTGQRVHRGQLVHLKPRNHLRPLTTSDEHPYYILRQEDVRMPHGRRRDDLSRCSPQWVPAAEVRAGDFVLSPVYSCCGVDTLDVARLFGCYAGNGSRIQQRTGKKKKGPYRLMGFAISGNSTQPEILEDIRELIARVAANPSTTKLDADRNAYDLRTYDQRLAQRLVSECGDVCENKRVPGYLYGASIQERLAFIGGLIDTDGSVDPESGLIRIPLSTEQLVDGTYLLGLSCGIRGSVSQYSGSGFGGEGESLVTCLSIAASHYDLLAPYSWKVEHWGRPRKTGGVAFDYAHAGVTYVAIEVEQIEVEPSESVVYNLSVDEDESYVAAGITVHNCVICGHWASKRAFYCTPKSQGGQCDLFGCKGDGMLKVAADGRQNYVDNPTNLFYDISMVDVGADPIAHGIPLPLGKLAGFNMGLDDFLPVAEYFPGELKEAEAALTGRRRQLLQLARGWAEIEGKYAGYTPDDDIDVGLVYGCDYSQHLDGLHSPIASTRYQAMRKLAVADICPDFASYAAAAGYSPSKIASMRSIVADAFTQLVRQRAVLGVVNLADFPENRSPNLATHKIASIHDGCNQSSVLSRALQGNAAGVQLDRVPRLNCNQTIPDVVAKYAAFKLAWAFHNPKIDLWRMTSLVKRELVTVTGPSEN